MDPFTNPYFKVIMSSIFEYNYGHVLRGRGLCIKGRNKGHLLNYLIYTPIQCSCNIVRDRTQNIDNRLLRISLASSLSCSCPYGVINDTTEHIILYTTYSSYSNRLWLKSTLCQLQLSFVLIFIYHMLTRYLTQYSKYVHNALY